MRSRLGSRSEPLDTDRQPLTSLGSSSFQNVLPPFTRHAFPETVRFCAPSPIGLKGALHRSRTPDFSKTPILAVALPECQTPIFSPVGSDYSQTLTAEAQRGVAATQYGQRGCQSAQGDAEGVIECSRGQSPPQAGGAPGLRHPSRGCTLKGCDTKRGSIFLGEGRLGSITGKICCTPACCLLWIGSCQPGAAARLRRALPPVDFTQY
jgi:hypothetical protein